jgi:hypothetical protein
VVFNEGEEIGKLNGEKTRRSEYADTRRMAGGSEV